jgi:hypothetical protein
LAQNTNKKSGVFVTARTIQAPKTVSPQARAFLSTPPDFGKAVTADSKDINALRLYAEQGNRMLTESFAPLDQGFRGEIHTHQLARTPLYELVPENLHQEGQAILVFSA